MTLMHIHTHYMNEYSCIYSLLYLDCNFFFLKSQSMIWFSRSLLPRSITKRPRRLQLEIDICLPRSVDRSHMKLRLESVIEWHSKCNRPYIVSKDYNMHVEYIYIYLTCSIQHAYVWITCIVARDVKDIERYTTLGNCVYVCVFIHINI